MKKTRNAHRRLRGSRLLEWAALAAQGLSLVCTWADISGPLPLSAQAVAFAVAAHGLLRR